MVKQVEVQGEQIIFGGNAALVASKSEPGYWHIVKNGTCDCKGYEYWRCVTGQRRSPTLHTPAR